jgi:hypothetical protein
MKNLLLAFIFSLNIPQTFAQTTYYSRSAGGDWSDTSSWTFSPDGNGPEAGSVPQRNDDVVILNGSVINVDRHNANGSVGMSPQDLGYGGFPSDDKKKFYQVGNITVRNGATLRSDKWAVMTAGDLMVNQGGNMQINADYLNLGTLLVMENSTLEIDDDLIILGSSETIINNDALIGDDIYIDQQQAVLCGTGTINIGDEIREFNGADASQQICDSFVISCSINCGMGTGGTFTGNGNMILPVELVAFESYAVGDKVELEWVTAMEENFDFFTVERASNDRQFKPIGTVQGQGNSTVEVRYSFTDKSPLKGQAFYRLKATDIDGTTEYHRIISVYHDGLDQKTIKVYPNPVRDHVFRVQINELNLEAFRLMDLTGRILADQKVVPSDREFYLPSDIQAGTYMLVIAGASGEQYQQIILVL